MPYSDAIQTCHVLVLDDDIVAREILLTTCAAWFGDNDHIIDFSDSEGLQEYIGQHIHPGDRCILISDMNIGDMDPIQNAANCATAVRAHDANFSEVYFVSGSIDDADKAVQTMATIDPTVPAFSANKNLAAANSFRAVYLRHHEQEPQATPALNVELQERKQRLENIVREIKQPLNIFSDILHSVIPIPEEDSLEVDFVESRGLPATGVIAYSYADLEEHHARGQKSIFAVDCFPKDMTADMTAYITKGYIAGVISGSNDLPGHIPQLLAGYGIPSLVSAKSAETFERLKREFPAGSIVTIDPAHKKLHTAECLIGEAFTSFMPPEAAAQMLNDAMGDFSERQKIFADMRIHVPSFEISASKWEHLDVARELKAGIGLLRSEFFLFRKPEDALIKNLLLDNGNPESVLPVSLSIFKDRCRSFMNTLSEYNDVPVKLRLVDIKAEEFLSEDDQAHWMDIPEAKRKTILALVTRDLHNIQMGVFSAAHIGKDHQNAPALIIPFDDRVDSFLSVSDDFRAASHHVGNHKWAGQDFRPCAMVESLEACGHIEDIAKRATNLSIGGNDLTTAILGVSRYDDAARLRTTRTSGVGRDPFRTIYPEVVAVIEDICERARAVNPDIRISFCGEQSADPDSIWRLRHAQIDTFTVPPTKECTHILPLQILLRAGEEGLAKAEKALTSGTQASKKMSHNPHISLTL